MDTTGGELAHAAIEMDEKFNQDPLHHAAEDRTIAEDASTEKPERDTGLSSTSSEDGKNLDRLDSRIVKVNEAKEGEEAYAHLPPHEREIVQKQLAIPSVTVTYKTLFRYATRNDIIIILISALCAIAGGSVQPLMTVSCSAHESGKPQKADAIARLSLGD